MRWYRRIFGEPTPAEFAALATAVIARQGATEILFDKPLFFLRYQSPGGSHIADLHNAFAFYCKAKPWHRSRILKHFFQSLRVVSYPDSWVDAAPQVRPALRDRFVFETIRLQWRLQGAAGPEVARRDLTDRLCLCLVYDGPDFMNPITSPMLDGWGVSFEEACDKAFINLRRATPRALWERPVLGIYISAWHDDYDASRLLLDELFQGVEVQGVPVAFVPHRMQLILTGSENLERLAQALLLAEAGVSSPNSLSALPLRRTPDGWAAWELPKDHPFAAKYRCLRIQEWAKLYQIQAGLLEAVHRREGVDVHVASFAVFQDKETGDLQSCATWTKGAAALLPRTEVLVLTDLDRPEGEQFVGYFPWDEVERSCGSLLQPTSDYPVRYRVESFPSEDQLNQLRSACEPPAPPESSASRL